jgi:hypothetical protein
MRWLKGALGPTKVDELLGRGLKWTESGYVISTDSRRQDDAALAADPFIALPFEMTLAPHWRDGLPADASSVARRAVADVAFVAHDPQSVDPTFGATVIIRVSEPVFEIDASLTEGERTFREQLASPWASLRSSDLRRVVLPPGEALRLVLLAEEFSLQFYLRTTLASFDIWFTGPGEEMREREAEFDAMAQSFRQKDGIWPFEMAKLHLAQSGNRRLFSCGRCGKGISLAWKKCDHCQATFDEFPPIATGEEIKAQPDVVELLTDL